jgi:hypothetical protein
MSNVLDEAADWRGGSSSGGEVKAGAASEACDKRYKQGAEMYIRSGGL